MNIEGETAEGTETVVVEEQAPKAKAKRSRAKKEVQKDTPSERAKRSSKKAAFDHSDFTEEEKKARGIETEEEKEIRVAKQDEEKKNAPKASKKKAKKGAAKAKPKAVKAKKAKADAKPKKVKAKAKPSDKGLTKAGEPRQKSEFDPDTTLGQRGAKIKLEKDELNDNEKEVLTAIRQARGPVKLTALADKCFAVNLGSKKRNSRVRNALRRLIRASFVKKTGRGEFEAKVAKKAA